MLTVDEVARIEMLDVALLLNDIDEFYGDATVEDLPQRVTSVESALLARYPSARVLLARIDGQAAGLAAFSHLWPAAGSSSSIYLKELYVRDAYRNRGVGEALLKNICKIASELGFSRIEWTTDRENKGAQRFYERLGVPKNEEKILYRLPSERFSDFIDS